MGPATGYAAAAAGAAKATEVGVSALARKLSKEGQVEEAQNNQDISDIQRNAFGPSKAEQEQQVMDAAALARQQAQSARAEAARVRAASGARGPDTVTAKIVQQGQQQVGQMRGQAAVNAAQLANKAKLDALARVRARAQKTYDDVASIHQAGEKAAEGNSDSGGGGGADFSKLGSMFGGS